MNKSFVHLRAHSDYSFLRALATPEKLVDAACKQNMPGIALTDIGNMFGAMQFYLAARAVENINPETPIKPILGIDFYFVDENIRKANPLQPFNYRTQLPFGVYKLPAICETQVGYKNLCKLSAISYENFIAGLPCVNFAQITKYHEGIIFLSGGYGGVANEYLLQAGKTHKNGGAKVAEQFIKQFATLKNKLHENIGEQPQPGFYIELQKNDMPMENEVNASLQELAKQYSVPLVATSEIYYLKKPQWETHEVFLAIGARAQMDMPRGFSNECRPRLVGSNYYFKTSEEMHALFANIPEALENTLRICERCNVNIVDEKVHMPNFVSKSESSNSAISDPVDKNSSLIEGKKSIKGNELSQGSATTVNSTDDFLEAQHRVLVEKTAAGLEKVNIASTAKSLYEKRIGDELTLIHSTGFSGYFLIVSDIVEAAKKKGVMVGPGRGSVVGSLVSYCLGITTVDPVKYDLLFERFLTADRVSLPDIDIDFQDDLRDVVIEYVKEKYGAEQVCQIVTFARLKAKAVFKDVCRVFGVDFQISNQLSGFILTAFSPEMQGKEDEIAGKSWLELSYKFSFNFKTSIDNSAVLQKVYTHALQLENLARQSGIHAAGVVIADKPIDSYVPLARTDGDVVVSQYDGRYLEEKCGLLKMDFLGLRTLTIVKQTLAAIEKNWQKTIDVDLLSTEDKLTYKLFAGGKTMGIFQFESPGMTRYVQELQPEKLDELIAMNALYRPGPIGWIPVYIANKKKKKPTFPNSEDEKKYKKLVALSKKNYIIEDILKPTQHIPIYQEQVMQISKGFAGFSSAEADNLRSAIAKKKKDKIDVIRKEFVSRSVKLGHDEKDAIFIYDDVIESFGSYGFNKSHSASYAYLAYQVAYLKANFPAEFFSSFLNNELNSLSVPGKFKRIVDECSEFSVEVTLPCVNESGALFQAKPKKIYFGLAAIKGVGIGMAKQIEMERQQNGNYTGIANFISRLKEAPSFNKQVIENLIKAGGFYNCLMLERAQRFECDQLIHVFPQIFSRVEKEKELLRGGQMSFFQQKASSGEKREGTSLALQEDNDMLQEAKGVVSNVETCKVFEKDALGFLFRYDYSLKYSALIVEINRKLFKQSEKPFVKDNFDFFLHSKVNENANQQANTVVAGLKKLSDDKNFRMACVVETVKEVFTKKDNKPMAIITANVGFSFAGSSIAEFLCFTTTWKNLREGKYKGKSLVASGQTLIVECREMRRQEGRSKTFSFEGCQAFSPETISLSVSNANSGEKSNTDNNSNTSVNISELDVSRESLVEKREDVTQNIRSETLEVTESKASTAGNYGKQVLGKSTITGNALHNKKHRELETEKNNLGNIGVAEAGEAAKGRKIREQEALEKEKFEKLIEQTTINNSENASESVAFPSTDVPVNSNASKTRKPLYIYIKKSETMDEDKYTRLKHVLNYNSGEKEVRLCEFINGKNVVFSCGEKCRIDFNQTLKFQLQELPFIDKVSHGK